MILSNIKATFDLVETNINSYNYKKISKEENEPIARRAHVNF